MKDLTSEKNALYKELDRVNAQLSQALTEMKEIRTLLDQNGKQSVNLNSFTHRLNKLKSRVFDKPKPQPQESRPQDILSISHKQSDQYIISCRQ